MRRTEAGIVPLRGHPAASTDCSSSLSSLLLAATPPDDRDETSHQRILACSAPHSHRIKADQSSPAPSPDWLPGPPTGSVCRVVQSTDGQRLKCAHCMFINAGSSPHSMHLIFSGGTKVV
jgi:hypothetical protein